MTEESKNRSVMQFASQQSLIGHLREYKDHLIFPLRAPGAGLLCVPYYFDIRQVLIPLGQCPDLHILLHGTMSTKVVPTISIPIVDCTAI